MAEQCSWCAASVGADDGFRVAEPESDHKAVFCRLEHVVPWVIHGASWDRGRIVTDGEPDDALGRCALCGDHLAERRVLVVRHRGRHRIADAFCRLEHLHDWARGGGRYKAAS
ncbi:hypothetical protein FSW04_17320 [Baekduia soli]|uniref:Uncharacterized protein n=1 Tax=Baekduia soli TaxID=496014 RepID=A0A5B8U7X4_9ACTN|nr:hypothetical protein [Baekduia soli]QEC49164.1 hypothetical protein FSW04_17320 [Baekduia soli]